MATRITHNDLEQALLVYCQRAGVPHGHYLHESEVALTRPTDTVGTITQNGRTFVARKVNETGTLWAIEGGYALSGAYGGWCVHRIDGEDNGWQGRPGYACTGVSEPFGSGHIPTRELYRVLRGAIAALEIQEGNR